VPRSAAVRCVLTIVLAVAATRPLVAQGGQPTGAGAGCCTVVVMPSDAGVPRARDAAVRLTQALQALVGPDGPVTWFSADPTARPRDAQGLLTTTVFVREAGPDSAPMTAVAWRVVVAANSRIVVSGRVERVGAYADSGVVSEIRREVRTQLPAHAEELLPPPCCVVRVDTNAFDIGSPSARHTAARLTRAFRALPQGDGPITYVREDTLARPLDSTGRRVRAPIFLKAYLIVTDSGTSRAGLKVQWLLGWPTGRRTLLSGELVRVGAYADSSIIDEIRREIRARLPAAIAAR